MRAFRLGSDVQGAFRRGDPPVRRFGGMRRQGGRLRHSGTRRALHRGASRQLLRRHGIAAVRDGAASRSPGEPARAPARMSEEILINVTPQETRVAILSAGVVQELLIERTASRGLVGNIYMGRVARVLPGMQSAFVEIGLERAAFLHVADIWSKDAGRPIEQVLTEGQAVMVQVVKDPIGTKGARLSTQISIAGRLLVYLPALSSDADLHIGISQRIEGENGRQALRERLRELLPAGEKGGYIIR